MPRQPEANLTPEERFQRMPLVSLLAALPRAERIEVPNDHAQKEFHRRFFPAFKTKVEKYAKLCSRQDLESGLNETFNRFFHEATTVDWPTDMAPENLDKKVDSLLLTLFVKQLPLSSLVILVQDGDELADRSGSEFYSKLYTKVVALVTRVGNVGPGKTLAVCIDEVLRSFLSKADIIKLCPNRDTEIVENDILVQIFEPLIKKLPIGSLVVLMAKATTLERVANQARLEFRSRLYPQISNLVTKYGIPGRRDDLEMCINEAFDHSYRDADKFNGIDDPSLPIADKQVLGWLFEAFIKTLPINTLVALLAQPETKTGLTNQVQKEFHRRFYPRVKALWHRWEHLGPSYDLDIHTNETFRRFFKEVGDYKWDACPNEEVVDNVICGWLFETLENQVKGFQRRLMAKYKPAKAIHRLNGKANEDGMYRKQKETKEPSEKDKRMVALLEHIEALQRGGALTKHVATFVESLNSESYIILKASVLHYDAYSGQCEMPLEWQIALCAKFNITQKGLRERRSRLTSKFKKYIENADLRPPESPGTPDDAGESTDREEARRCRFLSIYENGRRSREYERLQTHPMAIEPHVVQKFTVKVSQ